MRIRLRPLVTAIAVATTLGLVGSATAVAAPATASTLESQVAAAKAPSPAVYGENWGIEVGARSSYYGIPYLNLHFPDSVPTEVDPETEDSTATFTGRLVDPWGNSAAYFSKTGTQVVQHAPTAGMTLGYVDQLISGWKYRVVVTYKNSRGANLTREFRFTWQGKSIAEVPAYKYSSTKSAMVTKSASAKRTATAKQTVTKTVTAKYKKAGRTYKATATRTRSAKATATVIKSVKVTATRSATGKGYTATEAATAATNSAKTKAGSAALTSAKAKAPTTAATAAKTSAKSKAKSKAGSAAKTAAKAAALKKAMAKARNAS